MEQDCLTVEETTEMLKIGRTKLFELIRDKKIPYFRIGRDPKFPRRALLDWMDLMAWQTVEDGEEQERIREENVSRVVAELREMRRKGAATG